MSIVLRPSLVYTYYLHKTFQYWWSHLSMFNSFHERKENNTKNNLRNLSKCYFNQAQLNSWKNNNVKNKNYLILFFNDFKLYNKKIIF